MFRITEDPSSGSFVQCLAKIMKIGLSCTLTWTQSVFWQHNLTRCACVYFTVQGGTEGCASLNSEQCLSVVDARCKHEDCKLCYAVNICTDFPQGVIYGLHCPVFHATYNLSIIFVSMSATKFISIMLQPSIVGTTEREIAGVSRGQFGTVRLKFKLLTCVQETVGDRQEGLHTESFNPYCTNVENRVSS